MSQASNRPVSSRVLDAAIAWQLCLGSGQRSSREQVEFEKWYAASEEHARAWVQLGLLDQRFSAASGAGRAALLKSAEGARQRLRKLGSGLASVLLACGLALFLGERYLPVDYWLADLRTATGEQRILRLADGTTLQLNTHSALDVRFDEQTRRIVLRDGEVLVETGHGDARPFIVETTDGTLRALGTRFLVRREDHGTRLSVLHSAVAAQPEDRREELIVHEGQQVLMQANGLGPVLALKPGSDAWTRGMLVVDNVRLAELVAELGRYRSGYLGVDPAIADLRITGSFPLKDSDLALAALLPTLPVQIEQYGSWWTKVQPRPPGQP